MKRNNSHSTAIAAIVAGAVLLVAGPVALADDDTKRSAGETLDDTTINSSVKANLTDNDEVHARNINVETNRARVALIGYVRSKEQHESAIATAERTNGVVEVIDALLIVKEKRSTGRTLDDQTIETKLKYSLTDTGADQAFAMVTEVRNGEVLLGGFVESEEVKKRAGEIAGHVPGVTKVHNRLAVK
ncbi:MAG: BON domain-containing protein [Woeseiaceae bacterium]